MNPEDNKIFITLFVFIVAMVGVFSFMQAPSPSPTGYAVNATNTTYVNWLAIIVAAACIGVFAYWFNRKD